MEFMIPDTDSICVSSMDKSHYRSFSKRVIKEYAHKMVGGGKWNENGSNDKSAKVFNEILPDGLKSENNYLFVIKDKECSIIGDLWLQKRGNNLHIVSIYINETKRNTGVGTNVAVWLEKWAGENGFDSITLYVFDANKSAKRFYTKLGFTEYDNGMRKNIKQNF
ncbi:MAG: GNAT family N-acetyltransferase [Rickettsiales bacterium]|nr:GNAT family N-acetyltransferase [Pseudomonadota bacterium]MDA0966385.1 GNAT family N-acetyltransferase [Pseudomonadota bacterium]MDG4543246.1 GNAT family N-acetyltransferase [Rickettsiales bacterium]MDG4545512.1 GNAT family N-acetyltransferase [Rickettsiales bacterium]MDG4547961.1 GNAT family N-acetyltransferase [Rickettsiales bacterium]